ncbi:MAG: hypothetical protein KGJ75_16310 [Alphaproteobacteria bacterium]|nr:hypothetical protein [Alphaproteobacteria bacterium]
MSKDTLEWSRRCATGVTPEVFRPVTIILTIVLFPVCVAMAVSGNFPATEIAKTALEVCGATAAAVAATGVLVRPVISFRVSPAGIVFHQAPAASARAAGVASGAAVALNVAAPMLPAVQAMRRTIHVELRWDQVSKVRAHPLTCQMSFRVGAARGRIWCLRDNFVAVSSLFDRYAGSTIPRS